MILLKNSCYGKHSGQLPQPAEEHRVKMRDFAAYEPIHGYVSRIGELFIYKPRDCRTLKQGFVHAEVFCGISRPEQEKVVQFDLTVRSL